MNQFHVGVACLALLAAPFAEAATPLTTSLLNELAEELRANAPAIKASNARVRAAESMRQSVRTWPDPMVEFGGVLARKMMREEEGDIVIGVEQGLPLFGKPKAEKAAAEAEIEVATAQHELEFQLRRKDMNLVAFQLALADQELDLAREEVQWLETIQRVAESRYANGDATQVEALRAQTETARARNLIATAEQELAVKRVELNQLLNRPSASEWPEFELPPLADSVPFSEAVTKLALSGEPELHALRKEAGAAQSRVDVARKASRPELAVAVEGRQYSGSGDFKEGMVLLKLSIPWLNRSKYKADIRREEALSKAAVAEAARYETAVRAEIQMLLTRIDSARREALLYRDNVIPRAQQTVSASEAGWRAGADSLRDVLDARRMALDAQRSYLRAVADQYRWLSELVLCCGIGDLEALEMVTKQPEEAK